MTQSSLHLSFVLYSKFGQLKVPTLIAWLHLLKSFILLRFQLPFRVSVSDLSRAFYSLL